MITVSDLDKDGNEGEKNAQEECHYMDVFEILPRFELLEVKWMEYSPIDSKGKE